MKKIKVVLFSLMVMFLGLNNVFAKWTCEMEPKTLNITVGQTVKILAKQTGDEILRTLPTYTSANSSVVSVDISGNVKGVKAGTTTVSGSYGTGYECGTTTITVSASQDEWSGEMIPTTLSLGVGETGKVTARQTGGIVANTLPTYTSSNPNLATVDSNGNVKAIAAGSTIITGKFGNLVAGTTTVTVKKTASEWTGEMTPKTLSLNVGETGKVTARQTGDIQANTLPIYTSSNTNVATVDSNGNVKAIAAGTTVITGKFGNLVAGTTTVTVTKLEWTGEMTPKTLTITVGETGRVTAKQTGNLVISN